MKTKIGKTTKKKAAKKATQSVQGTAPKKSAAVEESSMANHSEVGRDEVREAARILKSGGSKKRERRRAASVMSTVGSRKGGLNRARNLSPEKLKEIAVMGGLARQAKARERAAQGLPNTRPRRAPMARNLSPNAS